MLFALSNEHAALAPCCVQQSHSPLEAHRSPDSQPRLDVCRTLLRLLPIPAPIPVCSSSIFWIGDNSRLVLRHLLPSSLPRCTEMFRFPSRLRTPPSISSHGWARAERVRWGMGRGKGGRCPSARAWAAENLGGGRPLRAGVPGSPNLHTYYIICGSPLQEFPWIIDFLYKGFPFAWDFPLPLSMGCRGHPTPLLPSPPCTPVSATGRRDDGIYIYIYIYI